ncbi:MAG: alpha/beta fold hydrolase [Nitrospirota bacterium]
MNPDIAYYKGDKDKPVIVFIHGLGMDKKIWENPSESRILGASLPITALLSLKPSERNFGCSREKPDITFPGISAGIRPESLKTSFYDMKSEGYTVVTWSQERPVGPIDAAVTELTEVIKFAGECSKKGIILVGHSRGGLIARKYLMDGDKRIKGLITVCTPHRGSSIAKLAVYISPLSAIITPLFIYASEKGKFKKIIRRIADFLESTAVRELLPGSDFFMGLNDSKKKGIHCMTIGGTSPSLFSLYRWEWKTVREGSDKRWILSPANILSVPDILEKIVPEFLYPAELKKGIGDGLVTDESSQIEWCKNHYSFPLNHAAVLFDRRVRNIIIEAIERICN